MNIRYECKLNKLFQLFMSDIILHVAYDLFLIKVKQIHDSIHSPINASLYNQITSMNTPDPCK